MGIYYDLNKLLSHNKILNFVIGPRGGGKSFAAKKWAINGWLKNRKEFIYLRRYNTELMEIGNWFSDIASFYPEHEFAIEGGHFLIDGEVAGYYTALSTSQQKKSVSYPNVNKIIFDEFIIDKGRVTYLKEEVQMFLDFYETVARLREDVTALLIANAITVVNPYFTYFHIYPKSNSKFITKSEVCVEIYRNDDFMEKKKNTKFGRLIDGTRYGKYAIENEFYRDNMNFIEKMTGQTTPWCSIIYMGKRFGVWYGIETGFIYFNKKIPPDNRPVFALTTSDHEPNYLLIKKYSQNQRFKDIKLCYEMGTVRFDCLESKQVFYEFMQLI